MNGGMTKRNLLRHDIGVMRKNGKASGASVGGKFNGKILDLLEVLNEMID